MVETNVLLMHYIHLRFTICRSFWKILFPSKSCHIILIKKEGTFPLFSIKFYIFQVLNYMFTFFDTSKSSFSIRALQVSINCWKRILMTSESPHSKLRRRSLSWSLVFARVFPGMGGRSGFPSDRPVSERAGRGFSDDWPRDRRARSVSGHGPSRIPGRRAGVSCWLPTSLIDSRASSSSSSLSSS